MCIIVFMTTNTLFNAGNFEGHNINFLNDVKSALRVLANAAKKYNKLDMDTLLNEFHDSYIGDKLGFSKVNVSKHGFDCCDDNGRFLESKVSSASASSYTATFNDTNLEKADSFKKDNVWLAYSIWADPATPICVAYGQHKGIGEFLEQKVRKFKSGKGGVRSTQSVSLTNLLFEYGFKLYALDYSKEEVVKFFQENAKGKLKKLTINDIHDLSEIK
ncbi:MAG: hypothetical protein J6R59_01670 [Paludibacteraceae bacterium]|nr:hypothetical protein [Paludibacteraceae bacterium]